MEETDGRADCDIFMHHLSKPCTSGAEELCSSKFAHEAVTGPVTPLPDRKNQVLSSPSSHSEEADQEASCLTPQGCTFDPFAPGPEELMLAPKKKILKKTCPPIQRRLNFDSCDLKGCSGDEILEEKIEEESFLETTYRSFLDIILPPRIPISEIIAISESSGTERKYDDRLEQTGCGKDMHLCENHQSKVGIYGVDDICFSKTVTDTVMRPPTPFPERKNLQVSSPSGQSDEVDMGSSCRTPREDTFDPFAPAPEGLMMFAPKKKLANGKHVPVQRKLNFDFCHNPVQKLVQDDSKEAYEDEVLLATLYSSILDDVISHQMAESVGESSFGYSAPLNGLKTPTYLPLLNGIAETCPGAPVRPSSKSRRFSLSICRKLEF